MEMYGGGLFFFLYVNVFIFFVSVFRFCRNAVVR